MLIPKCNGNRDLFASPVWHGLLLYIYIDVTQSGPTRNQARWAFDLSGNEADKNSAFVVPGTTSICMLRHARDGRHEQKATRASATRLYAPAVPFVLGRGHRRTCAANEGA
ncbi:hypothetical protein NPIL_410491 [Nephila pilipes]|uniref:Uncharacterized protein n=1 Tax=Nephila pilipes TaxID=299642 RepID=A0A8X6PS86_NEPPI|nr:hypothetical protein NPIL_410491 [Nephila pilipes]